jgi:SAM-dependent methyltransferase
MRTLYVSGGPGVDLYDLRIGDGAGTPVAGDVEFYLKWARKTGGPVLELGAGTGRVSVPLARAGHEVVGLDLSPHMLRVAKKKVKPGLKLTFVRGDMAEFDLGRKFRLILIPFRAFQHLKSAEAQRSCLACVRRHLAKGGLFIVDLFDPRLEFCLPQGDTAPKGRGRVRHPKTGNPIDIRIEERHNDPLTQVFREKWVYTERDGKGHVVRRTEEWLSLRWTYRFEMQYLLELSGLRPLACFGSFSESPPRYGAEQIWLAGM